MRVAIAGAGNVGSFIANDLFAAGHEVLLIEQQPEIRDRAEVADGVEWFIGDACEVTSLADAGLDRCDVVVAATGDDEDNLVVSLLAKQEFAVPRVIARVNHPQNEWMFNENWGVDLSVSTPHLITALVEEAVTVGRLVRLLQFEGGNVRLVEVTLADDSPVMDKAIREVEIPRDATVVAVIRGEHVVMPRGDTVFEARDEVLALVTPESEDAMRRILTGA
ncbi:MAG: TrkA family potassium uptake protein [Actinobacteria bacterium]|nr:TrkA family potassium uptake protein [Actinomycetota bacterium]